VFFLDLEPKNGELEADVSEGDSKAVEKKEPGKKPVRRKAEAKDYAIAAFVILIVLYEVGALQGIVPSIGSFLEEKEELKIVEHFNVLVPLSGKERKSRGVVYAYFKNNGVDDATLESARVINRKTERDCKVDFEGPITLKAEENLNLTVSDCNIGGSLVRLGVILEGRTTLRSRLLSDPLVLSPVPMDHMSEQDMESMRERMREQIESMPNADKIVDYRSIGTLVV
jgi:hypothetical protein